MPSQRSPCSCSRRRTGDPCPPRPLGAPRDGQRASRLLRLLGRPRGAELDGPVIFDLDGVLVDSEIWWDDVRRAFAAAHGRTWTEADRDAVMGANSAAWSRTM